MTDGRRLKVGECVRIRLIGTDEWGEAVVAMAGDNNPSPVLLAGAGFMIRGGGGGIALNALPLTIDYTTGTVISLYEDLYKIEVQEEPAS